MPFPLMKRSPQWSLTYTMRYRLAKMAFGMAVGAGIAATSGIVPARAPEPITISPADFYIAKSEALEQLAELEAMAAVSVATADYARLYRDFQDDITRVRPKLSEWSQAE